MASVRNYSVDDGGSAILLIDDPVLLEDDAITSSPGNDSNSTTPCLNEYCVSNEAYVDMIQAYVVPNAFEWALISFYIFVCVVGLSGNFLVCFAVWRNQHMRTVTNYFIVNLAVADFLVLAVCLPPTAVVDATETWYLGKVMCKIVHYMQGVSVSVSVLTLSFISVERWYAICHPLMFKSTTSRARAVIILIWVVSLLLLVPELVVLDTVIPHAPLTTLLTTCKTNWASWGQSLAFELFKMIALFFLPCCLMAYTYGQIVKCLWTVHIPMEPTMHKSSNGGCGSSNAESQLISRRKAAKMLIAVVIMFVVCYLPVHLLNILRYAEVLPESEHVVFFPLVAHWLCYFNSAVNPVIYNFMSEKFRKAFRNSICCCPSCRDPPSPTYTNSRYYHSKANNTGDKRSPAAQFV